MAAREDFVKNLMFTFTEGLPLPADVIQRKKDALDELINTVGESMSNTEARTRMRYYVQISIAEAHRLAEPQNKYPDLNVEFKARANEMIADFDAQYPDA